ncbi:MAG TPA: prolyl oligopeptidase family serine peptidase [Gammaproteobacteria bacterium]|nr:prolyl oligopeptidase family serine peptidase [Gammaproteobacteria bacterium]
MKLRNFMLFLFILFPLHCYASDDTYPLPVSTKDITFYPKTFQTSDGLTLHGHLAVPAGQKAPINGFPTVIIFVASGHVDRYENFPETITATHQPTLFFQEIEKSLVNNGIAVFLYDKRGVVPLDNSFLTSKITHEYETADANNLANDALKAFDYVSNLKQADGSKLVDNTKISLLGHSEGTILALTVANKRPSVKSLFLLGMMTRSMKDSIQFQFVGGKLRNFNLYDTHQDGMVTKQEYNYFASQADEYDKKFPNQASSQFLQTNGDWDDFYKTYTQLNNVNKISIQEFNYTNEQIFKNLNHIMNDRSQPWPLNEPRDWFIQYFKMDAFLKHELPLCSKMHVFQGEVDPQTLFEDALEIRNTCLTNQTPLASFKSYPGLTHGFSHYTGYKGWRYTIGPIDPQVVSDVTDEIVKNLK